MIAEGLEEINKDTRGTLSKTTKVNYQLRNNIGREVKAPTKERLVTNTDNREMRGEIKTLNTWRNIIESKV